MNREFKINLFGTLSIFISGIVVGILGYVVFSTIKDATTSGPNSIIRDFYLLMARTSYMMNGQELATAYADNELAANQKYKGKIIYTSGYVDDFKDENGIPVVHLVYNYEQQGTVKSIVCQMQERMLPILAKREKGGSIGIVGEVVGLVSSDSSVHLKNCLTMPRPNEVDSYQ